MLGLSYMRSEISTSVAGEAQSVGAIFRFGVVSQTSVVVFSLVIKSLPLSWYCRREPPVDMYHTMG